MKIEREMNLSALAELMGNAEPFDATRMRNMVVAGGCKNTKEVPSEEWIEMLERCTQLPIGLTGESAFYAANGPRHQSIMELQIVEAIARTHGTEQSISLADEARTYLAWLEDHESCANMPEDWEP